MTVQTLEPVIRQQSFFYGMEERHIELITGCASNVRFAEGQLIAREGDPADEFYLVREGTAAVECRVPHRGVMTVQTVSEGEILGWSWLFPPHRWHFDARAQAPTHALKFDGKCLRTKCEEDHDLGYEFMKRYAQHLAVQFRVTKLQLVDMYGT